MKTTGEIAQLGHAILRQHAQLVTDTKSAKIVRLVEDMLDILSTSNGVGLAAPQIFESVRLVIIASKPTKRYPLAPEMDPIVMFNPQFQVLSQETRKDWEGCLSIPGIRALVPRYDKINIIYYDRDDKKNEMVANGFIARIFQHEYDHLNGLVYLDRVENNVDIISETEFQKLMA